MVLNTDIPNFTRLEGGPAHYIGHYSDAVIVQENPGLTSWLFTSGTPGMRTDGVLPKGIEAQSHQAWENIMQILKEAKMDISNIVRVSQWLTRVEDVGTYVKIRHEYIGECKPAFMLGTISSLVNPDILVEIEVVAAKNETS